MAYGLWGLWPMGPIAYGLWGLWPMAYGACGLWRGSLRRSADDPRPRSGEAPECIVEAVMAPRACAPCAPRALPRRASGAHTGSACGCRPCDGGESDRRAGPTRIRARRALLMSLSLCPRPRQRSAPRPRQRSTPRPRSALAPGARAQGAGGGRQRLPGVEAVYAVRRAAPGARVALRRAPRCPVPPPPLSSRAARGGRRARGAATACRRGRSGGCARRATPPARARGRSARPAAPAAQARAREESGAGRQKDPFVRGAKGSADVVRGAKGSADGAARVLATLPAEVHVRRRPMLPAPPRPLLVQPPVPAPVSASSAPRRARRRQDGAKRGGAGPDPWVAGRLQARWWQVSRRRRWRRVDAASVRCFPQRRRAPSRKSARRAQPSSDSQRGFLSASSPTRLCAAQNRTTRSRGLPNDGCLRPPPRPRPASAAPPARSAHAPAPRGGRSGGVPRAALGRLAAPVRDVARRRRRPRAARSLSEALPVPLTAPPSPADPCKDRVPRTVLAAPLEPQQHPRALLVPPPSIRGGRRAPPPARRPALPRPSAALGGGLLLCAALARVRWLGTPEAHALGPGLVLSGHGPPQHRLGCAAAVAEPPCGRGGLRCMNELRDAIVKTAPRV